MTEASRRELGDFLRSRRARLAPQAVGLPGGNRRRTPGLRREEVAELAGIGTDWYVRLEQGRDVRPSLATVNALARALRLEPAERAHLRALARGAEGRSFTVESVPEVVRRVVESLPQPAYLTGRRWDLLAWNAATAELFADFGTMPKPERNLLLFMLTDARARRVFGRIWATEARRMVAQFRVHHDLWAGDAAFLELATRLRRECPEFTAWWKAHDVRGPGGGRKLLHHPSKGPIWVEYAIFQANDDAALRLAIYKVGEVARSSDPAAE